MTLEWKLSVYFMAIWYILWSFGVFNDQGKSGNPTYLLTTKTFCQVHMYVLLKHKSNFHRSSELWSLFWRFIYKKCSENKFAVFLRAIFFVKYVAELWVNRRFFNQFFLSKSQHWSQVAADRHRMDSGGSFSELFDWIFDQIEIWIFIDIWIFDQIDMYCIVLGIVWLDFRSNWHL
jgi:hypothetical protein